MFSSQSFKNSAFSSHQDKHKTMEYIMENTFSLRNWP